MFKRLLPLSLVLLSGCGFQLAGTTNISPDLERMVVRADDRYSVFYLELIDALRKNGVTIEENDGDDIAVLDISQDESGQRVLSVSARNVPREFEVYYTVSYTIRVDGNIHSGADNLTLSRDYTWNETQLLGKAREEEVLRAALVNDLVSAVLRRLNYSEDR